MNNATLGVALLSALSPPAPANEMIIDERVTEKSALPVGLVLGPFGTLGNYGSAFLIDRCHALTAKHVVGRREVRGKKVGFRLRPWEPKTGQNYSAATVIAAGSGHGEHDYSGDWALLRLERCLGKNNGYFPITTEGFWLRGTPGRFAPRLASVGFPMDRSRRGLTVDPACEARQRTTFGLRHDCLIASGNSGGPLIAWNATSQRFDAVAINVAHYKGRDGTWAGSNRVSLAVELLPIRAMLSVATSDERCSRNPFC